MRRRRARRKGWKEGQQLPLVKRTRPGKRGGFRPGAGRPKKPGAGVPHGRRVRFGAKTALHVTLRVGQGVGPLRRFKLVPALRAAFRRGCARAGFRLCQFSIQGNHIHLVVEADSALALARGMQALEIRIARAINRVQRRTGKVFRDRYHAERLESPRQVRNTLCYVLQNARRHGIAVRAGGPDLFSSAWWFDGWEHERWRAGLDPSPDGPTVAAAKGWLLTTGWRRWGPIGVDEVPLAATRP